VLRLDALYRIVSYSGRCPRIAFFLLARKRSTRTFYRVISDSWFVYPLIITLQTSSLQELLLSAESIPGTLSLIGQAGRKYAISQEFFGKLGFPASRSFFRMGFRRSNLASTQVRRTLNPGFALEKVEAGSFFFCS